MGMEINDLKAKEFKKRKSIFSYSKKLFIKYIFSIKVAHIDKSDLLFSPF